MDLESVLWLALIIGAIPCDADSTIPEKYNYIVNYLEIDRSTNIRYGLQYARQIYSQGKRSELWEIDLFYNRLLDKSRDLELLKKEQIDFTHWLDLYNKIGILSNHDRDEAIYTMGLLQQQYAWIMQAKFANIAPMARRAALTWAKNDMSPQFISGSAMLPMIPYWYGDFRAYSNQVYKTK